MEFVPSSVDFFVFPCVSPRNPELATDNRTNHSFPFMEDPALPTVSLDADFFHQLCMPSAAVTSDPAVTSDHTTTSFQSGRQSLPLPTLVSGTEPPSPVLLSAPRCSSTTVSGPASSFSPQSPPQSPPVHTYFPDLRKMVTADCHQMSLPSLLFQSVNSSLPQIDVGARETALLARLRRLETSGAAQVKQLAALFRSHSAGIEMERMQMLYQATTPHYRDWLNHHFDQQRHYTMDRVERSMQLLEMKTESDRRDRDVVSGIRRRNPLSRRAVGLMESWYEGHRDHPYPTATVVEAMSRSGNVTMDQVRKWFANRRIRRSNTKSLTEIAMKNHHDKFSVMLSRRVMQEQC